MGLTVAQARTLLRRRVQEPTADQWTNAELDSLLGLALLDVQAVIQGGDPEHNTDVVLANIVAGTSDYAFTSGLWWPSAVALLDSATAAYGDLGDPLPRHESYEVEAGAESRWVIAGRNIRIVPTPTTSVTNGLRVTYVKSLALGADSDLLPVVDPLHGLVVLYAEKWALGETGEAADAVQKEIDRREDMIPTWLRRSGAADRITVDTVKEYDS